MKRQRQTTTVDKVAIRLRIKPLREGGFLATSRGVPGLLTHRRSCTEAVETVQGPDRQIVESCREHGDPLPELFSDSHQALRELLVVVGMP